ncbi:hypothetical protein [Clostridium baratii]|uniref:hypothetical protein n=1 Tax=Clostridium baratii TaxID=1561 RepID=UPI0030D1AD38
MYALYKGEKLLSMGTVYQIAKEQNINVKTVYFYGSKANKRRIEKRNGKNSRILIKIEEE